MRFTYCQYSHIMQYHSRGSLTPFRASHCAKEHLLATSKALYPAMSLPNFHMRSGLTGGGSPGKPPLSSHRGALQGGAGPWVHGGAAAASHAMLAMTPASNAAETRRSIAGTSAQRVWGHRLFMAACSYALRPAIDLPAHRAEDRKSAHRPAQSADILVVKNHLAID